MSVAADLPAGALARTAAANVGLGLRELATVDADSDSHPVDAAIRRAEVTGKLRALLDTFPMLRDALEEVIATPPPAVSPSPPVPGTNIGGKEAARRLGMLGADGGPTDRFYTALRLGSDGRAKPVDDGPIGVAGAPVGQRLLS